MAIFKFKKGQSIDDLFGETQSMWADIWTDQEDTFSCDCEIMIVVTKKHDKDEVDEAIDIIQEAIKQVDKRKKEYLYFLNRLSEIKLQKKGPESEKTIGPGEIKDVITVATGAIVEEKTTKGKKEIDLRKLALIDKMYKEKEQQESNFTI